MGRPLGVNAFTARRICPLCHIAESGRRDSNPRSPGPKPGAIAATPRPVGASKSGAHRTSYLAALYKGGPGGARPNIKHPPHSCQVPVCYIVRMPKRTLASRAPSPAPSSSAIPALDKLVQSGFKPENLGQMYDTLRLLGVVMGHVALLDVIGDDLVDPRARVAAARALVSLKERPEDIVARLRASVFEGLSVKQLESIVQQLREGSSNKDLQTIIEDVKKREQNTTE